MAMEDLEKVELIREKTGVSYADAKAALETCDGNVLDAIIKLEREGKTQQQTASYSTTQSSSPSAISPEMAEAQSAYERSSEKTRLEKGAGRLWDVIKRVFRRSLDITFVVERRGKRVLAVPVLILVIALLAWAITLPALVVGLFCDCHYHFEGIDRVTVDVNDAMDRASSGAESIKRDVMGDNE